MPFFRHLLLLLCLSLLAASGCVRQPIDAAGLEVLRQGQLEEPEGDVDIAPVVYVNVRDNTNRVFGLRAQTGTCAANWPARPCTTRPERPAA